MEQQGIYDGATEPTYYGERRVWSVTGFTLGIRSRITDIPTLWVEGEISDLNIRPHMQTIFFTLKDPNNGFMLSCTMPKSRYLALRLELRDGDQVQCFGRPDIYAARGTFQLRAQSLELAGRGLLLQQLETLKAKLEEEGLFDDSRKRPLPFLPRRVGIITGSGAAAQGDFLRQVYERFPPVKLVMVETLVQGDRAATQIVAALRKLQVVEGVDVIVITRGGGAFEDFLPFSDERLCREIAACRVPVVSAIGHEKDSPISDFVADLRLSTPSAAARTVVPDYAEVVGHLQRAHNTLRRRGTEHVRSRGERQAQLRQRLESRSPLRFVTERKALVTALRARTTTSIRRRIEGAQALLERDQRALVRAARQGVEQRVQRQRGNLARLRALSPKAVLDRGYAIVRGGADDRIVRSADELSVGDAVQVALAQGTLHANVTEMVTHD